VRLLLRNWHLKLASVLVATVLYTGLVFSGTLSEDTVLVPVRVVNQPGDSYNLTGDLGFVEVRYRTATESRATIDQDAFVASVDLSKYDMERAPEQQALEVQVSVEGVDVLEVRPATVRVELDRTETRSVPVEVDLADLPAGLEIGEPETSETDGTVEVRGPASEVARVNRAVARVLIDPSGIDFDQPVTLTPVDIEGEPVGIGRVELAPEFISVRIDVETVETTSSVPVLPQIVGTPAAGFALEAFSAEPATVTVRGLPEALAEIDAIQTEPVDIAGASESQSVEAPLVLPDGVELAADDDGVVTVEISIGPSVSGRTYLVGVVCQGAGENGCQPGLEQLTLTLSGPSGVLAALTGADITPTLDASGLAPGSYTLTPQLPALPAGVQVISLTPGTVPVQIVAPATPTATPAP
jgi:YbbR domain-containing protein